MKCVIFLLFSILRYLVIAFKYFNLKIKGRESGTIHRYKLPNVELTHRYAVACEPRKIALNCISRYFDDC